MKLYALKMTNFRGYYGEQIIQFSTDPIKNVTVINGNNGTGKTTILLALLWCFYEDVEGFSTADLINKRILSEASPSDVVELGVEITFTHEGERYTLARNAEATKTDDNKLLLSNCIPTLVKIRADGNFERILNPSGVIESILPQNVSSYFFFDGEKIDEFARPDHDYEVRESVRNVLKIEVLDRARRHLRTAAKEYSTELIKAVPVEQQQLLEQQRKCEEDLDVERDKLNTLQEEQSAGQRFLEDISEKLGKLDDARQVEEDRKRIQAVLQAKSEERDRLWTNIRTLCNEGFPPLLNSAINEAVAILDEKRERGEMPPGIREQFLQDLIDKGRCICGTSIKKGSTEHSCLLQILSKSVSSDFENSVISVAGQLRVLGVRSREIPDQLRNALIERAGIDREIEQNLQALDEIGEKLLDFDHEDIIALEKKRQEYQFKLGSIATKIENCEDNIGRLLDFRKDLEAQLGKVKIKELKGQILQRKFSLANKAATAVDAICESFAADMRTKIQSEAKKIFNELIWKSSQFIDVSLSDNYHLEVMDRWGLPARRDLSAGERQVLSLSFITGLSKVTGEEAPLVMDTPLARLHSDHRENIALKLPDIANQLVLLVTNEELHSKARSNIEPRIGREYELIFDQTNGCISVKQIL